MTDDELLAKLGAIDLGDMEKAHIEADELVQAALRSAGFTKSADLYRRLCDTKFWYA